MSADTRKLAMAIEPPVRPWPFLSPLVDEQDDSPHCECDLTPTMTEVDSDKCAFCGRPIA